MAFKCMETRESDLRKNVYWGAPYLRSECENCGDSTLLVVHIMYDPATATRLACCCECASTLSTDTYEECQDRETEAWERGYRHRVLDNGDEEWSLIVPERGEPKRSSSTPRATALHGKCDFIAYQLIPLRDRRFAKSIRNKAVSEVTEIEKEAINLLYERVVN